MSAGRSAAMFRAQDRAGALRAAREAGKLEKRLLRMTGQAIVDYAMIADGDRVNQQVQFIEQAG